MGIRLSYGLIEYGLAVWPVDVLPRDDGFWPVCDLTEQ
jgi:hypothetical protein